MIKVIMGKKGSGKTKLMIDMINEAVKTENGNVVCIERNRAMTYNVDINIRLVEASDFTLDNFENLKGLVCGLYAGNYDITHMFIDSLCRVIPCEGGPEVEQFLDWLEDFSEKNGVRFTVTISAEIGLAHEGVAKYF